MDRVEAATKALATQTRKGLLGEQARWGKVGYTGDAHVPADGTYPGIDTMALSYTTVADSGAHPRSGAELSNLYPLIAAALYECGFAWEAGPLDTWRN